MNNTPPEVLEKMGAKDKLIIAVTALACIAGVAIGFAVLDMMCALWLGAGECYFN